MKLLRIVIKWLLIAFIAVSMILAVKRCHQQRNEQTDVNSFQNLKPLIDGQLQLVLFHNQKRCQQCLNMEQFTREVINEQFANQISSGALTFKTTIIDDPENRTLVDQFGIFAATLVLMEFKDEELVHSRVFIEGAELYRNQQDFKNYLSMELSKIVTESHD